MIITPIKKVNEDSRNQIVLSHKNSVQDSNRDSRAAEIMYKYQTIENSTKTKSMQHGFKNNTQTNFNQGMALGVTNSTHYNNK